MFFADLDTRHTCARRGDGDLLRYHRHIFVRLVRQHLPEPADATRDSKYSAKNADEAAGHNTGENQRDPEGQYNGPRRGRRQMNRIAVVT